MIPWHTIHGKSQCYTDADGLSLKRKTRKANLPHSFDQQIITAYDSFNFFKKLSEKFLFQFVVRIAT